MNARNRFREFLFASVSAVTFLGLQSAALAADSPKADQQQMKAQEQAKARAQDRDGRMCRKIVREHRGHPAKGADIVKVVYLPCPRRG